MGLSRVEHASGVVTYQSPLLEAATGGRIVHGFSTRIGGVSAGEFAALNFGNAAGAERGDDPEHIAENFLRLQKALGAKAMSRACVKQVHGRAVELIEREPEG
jgi:copper oxidase (laccase) domain-containing protein